MPTSTPPDHPTSYRRHLARRILDVFEQRADRVLLADRGHEWTGDDCLAHLRRLESILQSEIPRGATVGVLVPPSANQAFAIAATWALEYVPLVLDPWPARPPRRVGQRLHAVLTTAEAPRLEEPPLTVILGSDPVETKSTTMASTVSNTMAGTDRARTGADRSDPAVLPAAAGLALRTSGSSGQPKEVILSAQGLLYIGDLLQQRFALDPRTVAAVSLPLHHTMGLNTQFLPCLLAGGRSVFFPSGLRLGHLFRDLLDTRASFVSMVSDMIRLCYTEKQRRHLPAADSVSEMQLAGGHILSEHLDMARELFPRARLHKGYGLTEAIRVSMIHSGDPGFAEPTAGSVLPGQEVDIRDPAGRSLPPGEPGEIHVRGPNVMLGYGDGDSPFTTDGFLATGDLGLLTAEGRLEISGRRDRIFKSYGHRIAAPEIEAAVRSLDDVAFAGCIPVPCPVRGQRPILFLELTEIGLARFQHGGRETIEKALIRSLEPYKVPKDIVLLDTLPTLSIGKVDFVALARWWWHTPERREHMGQGPAGCRFLRLAAVGVDSAMRDLP